MSKQDLGYIKEKCGGGDDADFVKYPLTKEEIREAIHRVGCVSLEEIAYHRRKVGRLK